MINQIILTDKVIILKQAVLIKILRIKRFN
jgi:hypothetical protein